MGYRRVRYYRGGLEDWTRHGGSLESAATSPGTLPHPAPGPRARRPESRRTAPGPGATWASRIVEGLSGRSTAELLLLWFWMIVGFGLIYWLAGALFSRGLSSGAGPVDGTWGGWWTALYFSFVTALSIGYGDVVPMGGLRLLAVAEGAAGLILFGGVISRLVSRRQEELTAEIHRITFEDRLGRVRTNLHLVLSDLQVISRLCAGPGSDPQRIMTRLDSTATVFIGELRAIHDLLYRPQQVPDEEVLESILASLAASLREMSDLLSCLPGESPRSPRLGASIRSITRLANEICGECVPREYAPELKEWMDRIQALAGGLGSPH